MNPLNYEQLVQDYNSALNTQLRGFRPAEEYLDIWVPDTDHAKSILNLVEAAEMGGRSEISIVVGSKTLESMNLEQLETMLAPLGAVEIAGDAQKTCITVQMRGGNKHT